jgi:hypothetical protein
VRSETPYSVAQSVHVAKRRFPSKIPGKQKCDKPRKKKTKKRKQQQHPTRKEIKNAETIKYINQLPKRTKNPKLLPQPKKSEKIFGNS